MRARPAEPPPVSPGDVFAGRYRLERMLARGGMGSVWVAEDLRLERTVAVKFMDPEAAGSAAARVRFHREASAAAKLRTPHVVQIYDHGVHDDVPFIVMELLLGEDLATRLKWERRLSLSAASTLASQIAKGLRRAHEAGIVHRDLKPQNIFLARADDDEVVKILDFGVAKAIAPDAGEGTQSGIMLGSPHFMSPEQARGLRAVDHRTDLWALGVILFRALTGQLPFSGQVLGDVIIKICVDPITPPSSLAPLPPEVDAFFARALARPPEERFQSAREMADALAEIAGDAPRTSRQPSLPEPSVPPPAIAGGPAAPIAEEPPLPDDPTQHDTLRDPSTAHGTPASWVDNVGPALPEQASPVPEIAPAGLDGEATAALPAAPPRRSRAALWAAFAVLAALVAATLLAVVSPRGGGDRGDPGIASAQAAQADPTSDLGSTETAGPAAAGSEAQPAIAPATSASAAPPVASAETRAPKETRAPRTAPASPRPRPTEKRLKMY